MLSAADYAYAQSYTGILTLDSIPSHVSSSDTIAFSGRLVTASGQPVPGATIHIKDDVTFGFDQSIGTLRTNNDGYFSGTWAAETRSSGSWDFYAVFEGSSYVSKDRSRTYSVSVGNSYGPASTSIQLGRLPSSVYAGDTITFTGRLVSNGAPLQNALVGIYEDDPLSPDQFLASGRTDSDGRFSIDWHVRAGLLETDFDIYAEFQGNSKYKKSQTYRHEVSVYKYGGFITLDPIPTSARIGDVVTFSGRLSIDQHSPEGAVVYIKDEDTLNPDDLLVTSYVDSDGKFSATWVVSDVDADAVAEIYAVFEGGSTLGRVTTCDSGVTFDFGGSCSDTVPLRILPSASSPPVPPDSPASGAYMELYYSLNPPRSPHVVIVPSPDSYDKVRGHITPAREGIQMWSKLLEEKYGGNWDVKIDVLHEKGAFFDSKPDIIMNLVNHDDHQECFFEYAGIAYGVVTPYPELPIQTFVCSTSRGVKLSGTDVSATAGHEFIHAMGLGHTFNKPSDLMCSVENGVPTCPYSYYESSTPSVLNLEAIRNIYGSDGFSTPNSNVKFLSKFRLGDSHIDDEQERTTDTKPSAFLYNSITVQTDKRSYTMGEIIRVSGTVNKYTSWSMVASTIIAPDGNTVWTRYALTDGGRFSFDLTAGALMWLDGTYTISTQHVGDERGSARTTFQYIDITPSQLYDSQITDFTISVAGSDPITYFIGGGRVLGTALDLPGTLVVHVESWDDGYLQLTIPRTLLDAFNEDFFVLVDDSEAEFRELFATETHRTLLIEFLAGSERIEIIGISLWGR